MAEQEQGVSRRNVQRAFTAAGGDVHKLKIVLDAMSRVPGEEMGQRIAECAAENPSATAEQIIEIASRPTLQRYMSLRVSEPLRRALKRLAQEKYLSPEEVAVIELEKAFNIRGQHDV